MLTGWLGVDSVWVELGMVLVYLAGILGVIMAAALVLLLVERRVAGFVQYRLGPNRVGFQGVLQPVADMFKLLTKENITPAGVDKTLHTLAPVLVLVPTVLAFAVVPFGRGMIAQDLNIGIFYLIAVTSLTTIPFLMGGWGSNNKYSLLGGMRAVAQMISYEVPMVFSLLGVVMIVGSLQMSQIVEAQQKVWFVFLQPLAFFIYIIAATAECNRLPFDIPEGESELTAGVYTEYTGMKWSLFMMTEYGNLVLVSAVATTMFLGGWHGPLLPGWFWFGLKTSLLLGFFILMRWTFPRVRVDQLMKIGWKYLVPVSLVNIFITGIGVYLYKSMGW
ncbi:MAG: NADH-quinone oxidoreductase subunit NuoH [Peptococcaceae bacterium]|nr:NADH-quinone oxidoreductase subunit NuoH [Peptococcaceae bacterium]MDH7525690.1 NADH-quinone oxidoreductase subunit NuoH [Peptococcaceae bacterium]